MPTEGPLLPEIDEDSREFWQWCARRELRIQACASCGLWRMPPRPMCARCHSFETVWAPTSGTGTIWSFARPHAPLLAFYGEQAPYNVVVVALDDNPSIRLVGNVVTEAAAPLDSVDPEAIQIGRQVSVVFDQVADDVVLPRWIIR